MITHTPLLAGYFLIKTLVARQQPTNVLRESPVGWDVTHTYIICKGLFSGQSIQWNELVACWHLRWGMSHVGGEHVLMYMYTELSCTNHDN